MGLYRSLIRPALFRRDPEEVHDRAIRTAESAARFGWVCRRMAQMHDMRTSPRLAVNLAGVAFRHPVGLAAGFDKSGRAVPVWAAMGFSHVEIGSVSAELSLGNPKPRLFRIPDDRGIVVYYGLPNDGCERVAQRLEGMRLPVPLSINIVNTNRGPAAPPETEDSIIDDYCRSIRKLQPLADVLVLNLSCPNTPEGRGFVSNHCLLGRFVDAVAQVRPSKPVFLKVAPFADERQLDAFLERTMDAPFLSGYSVNIPPGKPPGLATPPDVLSRMPGAVSGPACAPANERAIAQLYRRIDPDRHQIIGAGGVMTAADAYRKVRLGASLVQLLTALVYEGPTVVRRICDGLEELLDRDGLRHISDAVGLDA